MYHFLLCKIKIIIINDININILTNILVSKTINAKLNKNKHLNY